MKKNILIFTILLIGIIGFSQETLIFNVDSTKTYEFEVTTLANNDLLYTHRYITLDNKQVIVKYVLAPEEVSGEVQKEIEKLTKEIDNLKFDGLRQIEMIEEEQKHLQEMRSLYKYKKARRLELINSL